MIRPIESYILVEAIEETHPSGLVVPETVKEKPQTGKVIAGGGGFWTWEDGPSIEKGDIVIYKRWEGVEVEEEGKKYILVEHEHVLAVKE